jgi:hypothetical protein
MLTDKYTHLSRAMDKVVNEANTEIQNLQDRLMSEKCTFIEVSQLLILYKIKESISRTCTRRTKTSSICTKKRTGSISRPSICMMHSRNES